MKQQKPEPAAGSKGKSGSRKRGNRNLEAGNLFAYLVYALLLHLLFFGLSAFSRNVDHVMRVREIPVELMGVDTPAQKEEGGGKDVDELDETKEEDDIQEPGPPVPQPPQEQAKVAQPVDPSVEPSAEAPIDVGAAMEAIETNSTEVVHRANIVNDAPARQDDAEGSNTDAAPVQRKEVSVAAAAARAGRRGGSFGLGRGKGSGRGGLGEGYGVKDKNLPVISGGATFGSGKKAALKGVLCYIPPATKRLKDVARCKPEGIMYTNRIHVPPRRFTQGFPGVSERIEWFAIDYNGHFNVSKSGDYKFRLKSDDGSMLWINGEFLIDNDGIHGPVTKIVTVPLEEGKHRLRLFYFQGPRTHVNLELWVQPPGEPYRLWSPRL